MVGAFLVAVNNTPESTEKYVLARCVSNELWYYGSWESEAQAREIAKMIDGVVVERIDQMANKECCGTCKWHQHENIDDGWVCVNSDSDYCADWTDYNDYCMDYEERE